MTWLGTGNPVPDREFQLFHQDTESMVDVGATNSGGVLVFENVPPDTSRPDAYCLFDTPVSGWMYSQDDPRFSVAAGENVVIEYTTVKQTS